MKKSSSKSKRAGNRPKRAAIEQRNREAFERASACSSPRNIALVVAGFAARGVAVEDIEPGVNVLTVPAWNHLGRRVIRGQSGLSIPVFKTKTETNEKTGEREERRFFGSSRVFHICQTVPFGEPDPDDAPAILGAEIGQDAVDRLRKVHDAERAEARELTTKTGVSRGVVRAAESSGMRPGSGELDDLEVMGLDEDIEGVSFAFAGDSLPSEIVDALYRQPVSVRAFFTCNARPGCGGGEDTLAERGADWMVERARECVLRSAGSVKDSVRVASADARGEMLAVLHDLRVSVASSRNLPKIELVKESALIEGAYFEIAGEGFAVYERDGVLRAGGDGRSFNLDRVGMVPVDAGTFDPQARVAPESLATPIPF